jgi:predicted transcriptional regulator YdeE
MSRERTVNPVGNALWYIESHSASDLTLEDVAAQSGVSRFHMTRAFAAATGWSVMRYVRGRRLTEAARTLASGAPDILAVALDAGYNCTSETSAGIPAQWQRFGPYIGNIPGQVGNVAYGVIYNGDDEGNADYMCGVEVTDYSRVPSELSRVRIPENRYAVFSHRDHISTIRRTFNTIWSKWFPESGHEPADAPFFERYDAGFDPTTGLGGLEIWIPLKK